jgi:hypothetical protein
MIQVYVYDRHENCFYPMLEGYVNQWSRGNYEVLGPVGFNGPTQGEFEFYLIQKGWPTVLPFPTLGEDPIPF